MEAPDVFVAKTDQCEYGLSVAPDGELSRKRTVLITNSQCLLTPCVRECSGSHSHFPFEGGAGQVELNGIPLNSWLR